MTILSCNVCGNFNEVHMCKEATYKMVESSFGHATEDAEMSESEVSFRQEEEFNFDKFWETEVVILPPNHKEIDEEITRQRRLKNKKEKEEKAALEGEPVTEAKPTKTLKRKKEKDEKVAEPTKEAKTKKSKRKKEKNEDGETAKPACTLFQKVCVEVLTQMNEPDIKRPVEIAIQALYQSTFFSGGNTEESDAMAAMMGERPKRRRPNETQIYSLRERQWNTTLLTIKRVVCTVGNYRTSTLDFDVCCAIPCTTMWIWSTPNLVCSRRL